jgi:AraC-like DNA-binding protein
MPTSTSRIRELRHESPLGRWTVTMLEPHALLHGIVRSIWQGEGRVSYARDRILPGGQSYLLVNLGPPQYLVAAGQNERRIPFDDAWFCGISDRPIDTAAPHGSVVAGVELTTTGAAALWPWRQAEHANLIGPLENLLGAGAAQLRERLLYTASAAARLQLLEDWLLARCVTGRRIHPLVHWATQRLAESAGGIRTAALARDAGCSRKHLVELFSREVGLPPKTLARVHRFRKALLVSRSSPSPAWSEIAVACGYYDQAHLTHDFQQFAGMPPAAFSRLAMPDSASIVVR